MRRTQPATLCYVTHNGKTLMLHRVTKKGDVHKGKWNGLGGKFIPGESPEECVVREVREECGLKIKNPRLRGVLTFPGFTPDTDWLVYVYTANRFAGKPTTTDEGRLAWIPSNKILSLPLWDGDKHFLKWLKGKSFFCGRFDYVNKKLTGTSSLFMGPR